MMEIVSAARLSASEFSRKSALGQSLQRLGFDGRPSTDIAFANRPGLPHVNNSRIAAPDGSELLVFMHDDVWIDDHFFVDRVIEALSRFDVIGVAGNRRRVDGQPGWAFVNPQLQWDDSANLSGAVAHGRQPFGTVSWYGPSPTECELLDGVLVAARRSALLVQHVRFDPRFDFHFYDLDFCRSARERGLSLGTWPIAITHCSGGNFGSASWQQGPCRYIDKWGL